MLSCPECGAATYPILTRAVTCSDPDCPRSNFGWVPESEEV